MQLCPVLLPHLLWLWKFFNCFGLINFSSSRKWKAISLLSTLGQMILSAIVVCISIYIMTFSEFFKMSSTLKVNMARSIYISLFAVYLLILCKLNCSRATHLRIHERLDEIDKVFKSQQQWLATEAKQMGVKCFASSIFCHIVSRHLHDTLPIF